MMRKKLVFLSLAVQPVSISTSYSWARVEWREGMLEEWLGPELTGLCRLIKELRFCSV